ncbi:alpha/beta fold hydrolase [Vibrio rumoiensis]|uniref:AB hydrolase-1 domain-containing protein n=1 Tax=Vibrio rumoiensis 1S-45 TaxID=1188252 RepID=A0A1E5E0U7_9VIBR|nr:alpha/beta hydrolase [Vibrio rumoiensis]OEF24049.1 hypothetical protein A1QC_02550 [Vibrio rumoiensis 1S-45]
MLKERDFQLSNIRLSALENGHESGAEATLIFVHGWLDNAGSFQTIMDSIVNQAERLNWYCLAIDLPGHGLSEHRSRDNYYPFHDYISDLHELLTKIDIKNLILVGHSLGALIASCYSAAFPEKVQGLIQIEGLGPLTENADETVARLRKGILSRQRMAAKPIRRYATRHDACLHRMHGNQLTATQLKPIIERGTYQDDEYWYWRYDPKLTCGSLYRMTEAQGLAYLSAIECSSLLILGDRGFPQLAKANERKEMLMQCEEVTVNGGHHCHIESVQQVSELIVTFVRKQLTKM